MTWISVNEKLPETKNGFSEKVLVWTTEHGALIGSYMDDPDYLSEGVSGEWNVGGVGDLPINHATVTHWCEVTGPEEK